ncbi:MAG: putative rane protein [Parcubacteria group bacterium]|nr:putative rane protein [Parcubacteria group bacterium]
MRTYLKLFCLALPILVALDASWLGVIASGFYRSNLGPLLATQPNYLAAIAFYVLYVVGIIYFALKPALAERALGRAIINGAMLGFISYMLYDLTNLSVLANWPLLLSLVDIAWGVILTGVTAGLTYVVATQVFKL